MGEERAGAREQLAGRGRAAARRCAALQRARARRRNDLRGEAHPRVCAAPRGARSGAAPPGTETEAHILSSDDVARNTDTRQAQPYTDSVTVTGQLFFLLQILCACSRRRLAVSLAAAAVCSPPTSNPRARVGALPPVPAPAISVQPARRRETAAPTWNATSDLQMPGPCHDVEPFAESPTT